MTKLFKQLIYLLPISVMIISCYPEFDATVDELDLAITKYDDKQDFSTLSTFFLYDTVIYITDDEEADPPDFDRTQGPHIIAKVRENLLGLGWVEETDTVGGVKADASILISALEVDVSFYYYGYWDYWYWYPWYPGYPIYPGYPSYSYTVGTVLIDMVNMGDVVMPATDIENPSFDIPIVWTGAVNGILSGSDQNIENRLTKQIGQVFEQSTYLNKKEPRDE